jgi:hypothetical protein
MEMTVYLSNPLFREAKKIRESGQGIQKAEEIPTVGG